MSSAQWREDLAFLARELPLRHANAFHFTPRERFETAVKELDQLIDHIDADAAWVGMQRIVALIGDAHTYLKTPSDAADLPIDIAHIGEDYRIVSVIPGLEKALGARVKKIQEVPITRAVERIVALAAHDENPPLARSFVENALTTGATLHGLGIIPNRQAAGYLLVDDAGREFAIEVHARESGAGATPIRVYPKPPVYRENPESTFWCRYLPEGGTLYCNVRAMRNLYSVSKDMLRLVAEKHSDKLAIDLRQNDGGDYTVGKRYLVDPVRQLADINRNGHLFVLVGAATFSAAMVNAAQFRAETNAILVGQTIGEKPASYQEPRNMDLPNSHLTVRYSTRYYDFSFGGENVIRPDQEIVPTWEEYKEGRDPVLERILKYPAR